MNRILLMAMIVATACGCRTASPIGMDFVGPGGRAPEDCALRGDFPSTETRVILQFMEAEEEFEETPNTVIRRILDYLSLGASGRELLFTLAELAYLDGERTGSRDAFLLSAIAAYTYLEGDPEIWGPPPTPYGHLFRWSCDMYGLALGRAFSGATPGTMELSPGVRDLPVGQLEVKVDFEGFPFELAGLQLLLADQYQVRGLDFHVRDSGLGVPLVAVVQEPLETTADDTGNRDSTCVAATAFLQLDGNFTDQESGFSATLSLHSTYDAKQLTVGNHVIPLNSDQSAVVAFGTDLAGYWRHDLAGFFGGNKGKSDNGLVLPRPYESGRIPVVLVHGTASSPTYWSELLNVMAGDPAVRSKYQFWLFQYDSGSPVVYSAAKLRSELIALCDRYDPQREDPSLNRMILVGHSQGGLLVKMLGMTLRAEDAALSAYGKPIADLELSQDQLALVRKLYDIEPLPQIERMIFIATPHRGSTLADSWYARLLARMIHVPGEMVNMTERFVRGVPSERLPSGMENRVHTSLDDMNPNSMFVKITQAAPLDPTIHLHSIIAIGDYEATKGATDGVVRYSSAHLDAAESEVLVPSDHSCQTHTRTLLAIRQVLHEELGLDVLSVSELLGTGDE